MRRLTLLALSVIFVLTAGCVSTAELQRREREQKKNGALAVAALMGVPLISQYYQKEGRWPESLEAIPNLWMLTLASPEAGEVLNAVILEPQSDGSLRVLIPRESGKPTEFRIGVPGASNPPNKAPEPTPGSVTPRATEGASK
jgi:hypothetical protein